MIDKKIHGIWLGKLLGNEGRKNVQAWVIRNPDYNYFLWVDSRCWKDEKKEDIEAFKSWADNNNVILRDIATEENVLEKDIEKCYDFECHGKLAGHAQGQVVNYAAASDILRLAILYKEGGVYHDMMDVFPSEEKLGDLNSRDDFMMFVSSKGYYNYAEDEKIPEEFDKEFTHVSNHVLAANKGNHIVEKCLVQLPKQYQPIFNYSYKA